MSDQPSNPPDAPSPEEQALKGAILQRLISAGKKHREAFMANGKEIERYGYAQNYDFEYQGKFAENAAVFFKAKVAKTAQAVDTFGPYLYPANPTRRVESRPWATEVSVARSKIMGELLNYLPDETDLYLHARRAVNQAIVYGRGVLWTGYNPEKQIVQSIYDTVENLIVDPDAYTWEQVNWVARRRRIARWAAMKRYPGSKALIRSMDKTGDRATDKGASGEDPMSEMVELYEMHFKVGLANYKGGSDLAKNDEANPDQAVVDDSPRKYIVTGDGKMVKETTWEVPWFRDGEWPCTILDFRDMPDSIWPVSPLSPGLGHQRALNWIYTLYLSKLRYTTRSLIGVLKNSPLGGISEESVTEALYGGELPVIEFSVTGGGENVKLSDFIQQFNFQDGMAEFERASSIINREFEMATGLSDVLQTGEGRTQDRSAEATKFKRDASTTRVNDMKSRVERWMSVLARKEAIAARFLMGPDEIGRIFGPEAAQVWGEIMDPGADFDSFFLETDYSIVSGSMIRQGPEQAQDATEAALNQAVPALFQAGAVRAALAIVSAWAKAWDQPEDIQKAIQADLAQLMAPPQDPAMGAPPGEAPIGAGGAMPAAAQPMPPMPPMPLDDALMMPTPHL